jgi:hypothetical protein
MCQFFSRGQKVPRFITYVSWFVQISLLEMNIFEESHITPTLGLMQFTLGLVHAVFLQEGNGSFLATINCLEFS